MCLHYPRYSTLRLDLVQEVVYCFNHTSAKGRSQPVCDEARTCRCSLHCGKKIKCALKTLFRGCPGMRNWYEGRSNSFPDAVEQIWAPALFTGMTLFKWQRNHRSWFTAIEPCVKFVNVFLWERAKKFVMTFQLHATIIHQLLDACTRSCNILWQSFRQKYNTTNMDVRAGNFFGGKDILPENFYVTNFYPTIFCTYWLHVNSPKLKHKVTRNILLVLHIYSMFFLRHIKLILLSITKSTITLVLLKISKLPCQIILPKFSINQNFWGCQSTPSSYATDNEDVEVVTRSGGCCRTRKNFNEIANQPICQGWPKSGSSNLCMWLWAFRKIIY